MRMVAIKNEYIEELKVIETKVLDNYSEDRLYLGVVFEIEKIDYFVPLSSPKEKDYERGTDNVRKDVATIYHLCEDEERTKTKHLGKLAIANMIPVPKGFIQEVDFNNLSTFKKTLVNKQMILINRNVDKISNKCKITRRRYLNAQFHQTMQENICDFKALEEHVKSKYPTPRKTLDVKINNAIR